MTVNMFGYSATSSYIGPHVWAINKAQMYDGAPTVQVADFAGPSSDFTVLPANARRLAGVLRLDGAVPERAQHLQVPRRLGQDLDLDLHRSEHPARAELLAER